MAAILSINDMSDIRCTIVIGIFCIKKKKKLKVILNMSGQYQPLYFENSVELK